MRIEIIAREIGQRDFAVTVGQLVAYSEHHEIAFTRPGLGVGEQ